MQYFVLDNRIFFFTSNSTKVWKLIEEISHAGENLNCNFKHQLSATTFIIARYELSKGEIAMN